MRTAAELLRKAHMDVIALMTSLVSELSRQTVTALQPFVRRAPLLTDVQEMLTFHIRLVLRVSLTTLLGASQDSGGW